LSYFEAIHWRKVDSNALKPSCKPNASFRQRGYWASKNPKNNTSRDRYAAGDWQSKINVLEMELHQLGCGLAYVQAIQNNIKPFSLVNYHGALARTLASKRKAKETELSGDPY
jgi:hypothetical protein